MRVEKLSIENFRNFKKFEIELQDFTLIIGENNIGKTNLLYSIGLVLSSDISFFVRRNLKVDDINYEAIQEFKSQIANNISNESIVFPEVKIDLFLSNFNEDQEAVVGDWFTGEWLADISTNKAKITYIFSVREDLGKWIDEQKKTVADLTKEEDETEELFLTRKINFIDFPIEYYEYFIFGGDDPAKSIDYRMMKFLRFELVNALRDPESDLLAGRNNTILFKVLYHQTENKLQDVKKQIFRLSETLKNNNELNELKKEIETYLENISLVGDDSKIDFDYSQMEAVEMLKKLSMIYGTNPIPISRNGLGRNNLLFISLLLSHLLKTNDTKNKVFFRLIGIEEPEAHLHPHLQENLSKKIFNGIQDYVQIIATSHSPHITAKLPLDNAVVLYNDNGEVKPYYLLKHIPHKSKIYIQKYLDATKATMFYARKLILVEGISEQLLLPKFFEIYKNKSLEQYGCNIVNVNGVAFKHFLETIKAGYFIKCAVVTDSDSNRSKKIAERASNLSKRYSSEQIIIRCTSENLSTFEKEIIDANKTDPNKEILFNALIKTRPINGKKLKKKYPSSPIEVEEFFNEIELRNDEGEKRGDFKSEFSMNLLYELNQENQEGKFIIPSYIQEVFDFIVE